MQFPILTYIIFTPLLGAIVLLFIPKEKQVSIKITSLIFSGLTLLLTLILYINFKGEFIDEGPYTWIKSLGVSYYLGVDGLSLLLVFLTALLTFLSVIYSWIITERPKEYFFLFLLLEVGMLGVFLSFDYILFYIFWEVSLVPMYFLIGIWGGPRREYAAIKFFLYTLVGSLAMLLAILGIYFDCGAKTFNILEIAKARPFADNFTLQSLCFLGFFLAFAIKVPLFPFHTWLPDAHVEAPTAGSVILAGVLLKMGGYGFIRVSLPTFPEAAFHYAFYIAILALISIIYGALVAMAQTDFKRMIANSSVNHMGYVMLGIAAAAASDKNFISAGVALNGAILQMFNHGVITGALFILVGVIYERTHIRDLNSFGGLGAKVPVYAGVLIFFSLASLGLPALSGFISEFLVFLGSFKIYTIITALALLGVLITAAFFLWMIQRVLLGPLNEKYKDLIDMDKREIISLAPLMFLTLFIGLYPGPILKIINTATQEVLKVFVR